MAGRHKAERGVLPSTGLAAFRLAHEIAPYEWGGWLLLPRNRFIEEDTPKAKGVERLAELAALQTRSR